MTRAITKVQIVSTESRRKYAAKDQDINAVGVRAEHAEALNEYITRSRKQYLVPVRIETDIVSYQEPSSLDIVYRVTSELHMARFQAGD